MSEVNHEAAYIFVHNPKAAGTSVETIIGGTSHETRWGFDSKGLALDDYFKFMIGRNPYTRLTSCFNFFPKMRFPEGRWEHKHRLIDIEHILSDFEIFVNNLDELFDFGMENYSESVTSSKTVYDHLAPQYYWACISGVNRMDRILKFEDLENEWNSVRERVGKGGVKLPHRNKSSGNIIAPEDVSKKTISIINEKYARDFELLGYPKL
jgi:hypothetical protein